MKSLNRLFFHIDMTWIKVILFACITGVYTGIVNLIPALQETSFSTIAVTFECWIIFALLIITNCKKPIEATCKTFVFFLISQPLVYLVESPFLGFEVFRYYPKWFIWTLLTIPMSYIAWYIRKKNLVSAIILSLATGLLALTAIQHLFAMLSSFPHYLLSFLFCLFWIIFLPLVMFQTKKNRIVTYVITLVIGCGVFFYSYRNSAENHTISNVYEIDAEGNWSYSIDADNFSIDENEGYVEVTASGNASSVTYLHCINDETGEEKLVKVIYEDGAITFEEE